jgi:hypothetical protein
MAASPYRVPSFETPTFGRFLQDEVIGKEFAPGREAG